MAAATRNIQEDALFTMSGYRDGHGRPRRPAGAALTVPWPPNQGKKKIEFRSNLIHPAAGWPQIPYNRANRIIMPGAVPPIIPTLLGAGVIGGNRVRFRRAIVLADRLGMQFQRILGFGGMGLATLFDTANVPPANRAVNCPQHIVVKTALDLTRADSLEPEKLHMALFRRAEHLLRRLYRRDVVIAAPAAGAGNADIFRPEGVAGPLVGDGEDEPAAPPGQPASYIGPTLVMEYAPLGPLEQQLIRLQWANPIVPPNLLPARLALTDEELWRILECLVRGCIAMAFPPRAQIRNAVTAAERAALRTGGLLDDDGPPFPETLPAGARIPRNHRERCNFVHFDIEPSNIFLGDYVPPPGAGPAPGAPAGAVGAHTLAPIFKISDFGLAYECVAPTMAGVNIVWGLRARGKEGIFLPEQFTEEWDSYSGHPYVGGPGVTASGNPRPSPSVLAGRYDEKSNIWQVGYALWCCMTAQWSLDRPWAERVTIMGLNGRQINNKHTYGYLLDDTHGPGGLALHWANVSKRLRDLVMQCMMHDKRLRPTLQELETECLAQVQAFNTAAAAAAAGAPAPTAATLNMLRAPIPPAPYVPVFGNTAAGGVPVGTALWHADPNMDLWNQVIELQNYQQRAHVML